MKFAIEKNILIIALNNVLRALSQKVTIPVLNGIKFELKKEGLFLTGSDSELTINIKISEKEITKISKEGTIIIQSKYILDIIRKMPNDIITFEELENQRIKIYTDTNEFVLNCYDKNDYPNISMEKSKENITMEAKQLKDIINSTSYAISTQELRPLLTGINFKLTGNLLECVATDSYRLSKKTITIDNNIKEINIVIPGRSINELEKILGEEDNVELHFFNNKLLIIYQNILFQTNLLNGSYPSTGHFIPKEFEYIINLNLNTFYNAIDRSSILAQNKEKNIVKMIIQNNEMIISSFSNEIGATEEKLAIDSNNKTKLEISFSSKYMLDALKVVKEKDILLLLNSDDKPILIKQVNDETLTELILPIKNF